NCNWSWRPYFLNHLYESYRQGNPWVISQPYNDIMENLLLRTFSKTFKDRFILFIDVLYEE
ncbi:MAG TPA: EAL-associated domain-containing protein, partial [Leptospiraceae bacterium]|nr:EAL-associated domain-containing protein [Leptospiraceae bacterium]